MDEHARLVPGLAQSWKLVAPDTWELKLRDAKFQNGNAFVADDVVFTMDRIPKVPNSPSNFAAYTKPVVEHRGRGSAHHPPAHQGRVPAAADLSGAVLHHQPQGRRGHGDRGLQQRQGGDRHRAVPLRLLQAGRPRRAGAQRQLLGTEAGLAAGRLPLHHQRCLTHRGAACRRCRLHRLRAHRGSGEAAQGSEGEAVGDARPAADLPRPRPVARRAEPVRVRPEWREARQEPAEGPARAPGTVAGDQPPGDRRSGDGRRGGAVRPVPAAGRLQLRARHQAAAVSIRSRRRSCWRRPASPRDFASRCTARTTVM